MDCDEAYGLSMLLYRDRYGFHEGRFHHPLWSGILSNRFLFTTSTIHSAVSAPYSHQNSGELKYMARRCGNCWNASTS